MSIRSMKTIGGTNLELLASTTITTAVTKTRGSAIVSLEGITFLGAIAVFTYGSGGTTAKFYLQTSFDKGVNWTDIMCFAFTTASATKFQVVKAGIAVAANQSLSDTALADNTILDGTLGDRLRVSYTTTGTYAGSTTIKIDGVAKTY